MMEKNFQDKLFRILQMQVNLETAFPIFRAKKISQLLRKKEELIPSKSILMRILKEKIVLLVLRVKSVSFPSQREVEAQ